VCDELRNAGIRDCDESIDNTYIYICLQHSRCTANRLCKTHPGERSKIIMCYCLSWSLAHRTIYTPRPPMRIPGQIVCAKKQNASWRTEWNHNVLLSFLVFAPHPPSTPPCAYQVGGFRLCADIFAPLERKEASMDKSLILQRNNHNVILRADTSFLAANTSCRRQKGPLLTLTSPSAEKAVAGPSSEVFEIPWPSPATRYDSGR
jgi:hypothetical protein